MGECCLYRMDVSDNQTVVLNEATYILGIMKNKTIKRRDFTRALSSKVLYGEMYKVIALEIRKCICYVDYLSIPPITIHCPISAHAHILHGHFHRVILIEWYVFILYIKHKTWWRSLECCRRRKFDGMLPGVPKMMMIAQ